MGVEMKMIVLFLTLAGFVSADDGCNSHFQKISHIKFQFAENDTTCGGKLKIIDFFRQGALERVKVRLRNFDNFWEIEDFGDLNKKVMKCVISTRIKAMDRMKLDMSCKKKIEGWIRHNIEYFGIEYGH